MPFATLFKSVNMIYVLFCYLAAALRFAYNVLWFVCVVLSAGVPWMVGTLALILVLGKWIQLKRPSKGSPLLAEFSTGKDEVDGGDRGTHLVWPVASRGADFDAPENSAMALKMV